jgi:hypothetical protein
MEPTKTPTRTKRRERTLASSLLQKTTRTKAKTAALAATTNGNYAPESVSCTGCARAVTVRRGARQRRSVVDLRLATAQPRAKRARPRPQQPPPCGERAR